MTAYVDCRTIDLNASRTTASTLSVDYLLTNDSTSNKLSVVCVGLKKSLSALLMIPLLVATGGVQSIGHPKNTSPQSIVKTYELGFNGDVKYKSNVTVDKNKTTLSLGELSNKLQHDFGFSKVAPWAKVLKVERKTIYDWRKRPSTEIQPRIAERLSALKSLYDEMEPSHRKFLYSMAFGKWSNQFMTSSLLSDKMNKYTLSKVYDELFFDFVGMDKREQINRV